MDNTDNKADQEVVQIYEGNKKSGNPFKAFLKVLFVEDWGLKFLALAFATAVWIIFKIS